jgi:long-chain fatty acid transport protein
MPSLPKRRAAVCSAALIALAGLGPDPARAAGFAIFEQGAQAMGFAGAFTAQASDPSAIFHNAAGIAFLKGHQLYLGATLIHPSTDFTGDDPFPGAGTTASQSVGILPVPAAYYTHQFSETVVFGIGLHAPFGLKTEWADPEVFSGRFITQTAELKGFSLNPTVAIKLADRLALGGGVDIRFASVTLERAVPLIDPFTQTVTDVGQARLESDTAFDIGFNLGLLARPSDSLSLGLSYRHKVHMDLTGGASFTQIRTGNPELDIRVAAQLPAGEVPLSTAIEFPAILSGGVAYAWSEWRAELDVNWYQWSTFDRLVLEFETRPDLSQTIEEDYESVFQYRLGVERRLNDTWQVRGGYFFDKSPAPPESVSPLLPDASRHGLALGGTWRRGALRLDGSLWTLFTGDRSTEGRNRDRFDGSYSTFAINFGLFLGYSF